MSARSKPLPPAELPFDPNRMPSMTVLLDLSRWHDAQAMERARTGSAGLIFHNEAALLLRELHDYLIRLKAVLEEKES